MTMNANISVIGGTGGLSAPRSPIPDSRFPTPASRIDETAKDFETVFLAQMMKTMFEGQEEDSLASDPETDDIYREWMTNEYARIMSDAGGIGVAAHIKRELIALQEVKS